MCVCVCVCVCACVRVRVRVYVLYTTSNLLFLLFFPLIFCRFNVARAN